MAYSIDYLPQICVTYREKKSDVDTETVISCAEFVDLSTARAKGKRLAFNDIKSVRFIQPLPYSEPEEEVEEADESTDANISVDEEIAKDIFDTISSDSEASEPDPDTNGTQLGLFDE